MAEVKSFVKERLRPVVHDEDHTRISCIYAHYRRWAFLKDLAPYSAKNFETDMARITKREPEEFRGERLYPIQILVIEKEDENEPKKQEQELPIVIGEVEVTTEIQFYQLKVPVGTKLQWLEPTTSERESMRLAASRDMSSTGGQLVIMLEGKRRMVSTSSIRRLL